MARLGIQLPVIEKCLNHVSGSFAGGFDPGGGLARGSFSPAAGSDFGGSVVSGGVSFASPVPGGGGGGALSLRSSLFFFSKLVLL
jgi:hypothetical protein